MPVPVMDPTQDPLQEVSKQLRRLAASVDKVKRSGDKHPKASLGNIAANLKKAADALDAGNQGPNVADPQYKDMADAFQAIADELRPAP